MLVSSPLVLVFVKQKRPEYYGMLPDGIRMDNAQAMSRKEMIDKGIAYATTQSGENEFGFRQAVRTSAYWIIAVTLGIQMVIFGAINIHIIPFLTDIGFEKLAASNLMMLMVLFTLPARFIGGIWADRVSKQHLAHLLAGGFALEAIGIALFLVFRNTPSIYAFLICHGLCTGGGTLLFIMMLSRFFGRKSFGTIFGSSIAIRAPLSLLAPVFAGWMYDRSGDYIQAFTIIVLLSAISVVLLLLVRAPELSLEQQESD
jgi:cyanate permease